MPTDQAHGDGKTKAKRRRHPRIKRFFTLSLIAFLAVSYIVYSSSRPLPIIQPRAVALAQPIAGKTEPLAWPEASQSALGALGYGVLETHGENKPVPTASVAKVLTALAVLKQKPLLKGEQGPVITITAEDVAAYKRYASENGSHVPVELGEQITEYQALQALLLPSANNMADLLVRWAFGSEAEYVNFANSFVKSLGLTNTFVADASGFSPKTVSTAHDLVLLGENIMDNPVLAEIVGQAKATIPVAGEITNSNVLLGYQEIVGIKTGNTDEAGSCYLFAAKHEVAPGQQVTIIGITMGAADRATATDNSMTLLRSSYKNFTLTKAISKGQVVGTYRAPWGGEVQATAAEDVVGINWKSQSPKMVSDLRPIASNTNRVEGDVGAIFGRRKISSPLVLDSNLPAPNIKWRAKRLLFFGKIL